MKRFEAVNKLLADSMGDPAFVYEIVSWRLVDLLGEAERSQVRLLSFDEWYERNEAFVCGNVDVGVAHRPEVIN